MQSCSGHSSVILMMYFMYMFVKKRGMQQVVGGKEEKIFKNMEED